MNKVTKEEYDFVGGSRNAIFGCKRSNAKKLLVMPKSLCFMDNGRLLIGWNINLQLNRQEIYNTEINKESPWKKRHFFILSQNNNGEGNHPSE